MLVTVTSIRVPAMSTIGFGVGTDEDGNKVSFVGDHRPMRDVGEAAQYAFDQNEAPIQVDLEDWQITKEN